MARGLTRTWPGPYYSGALKSPWVLQPVFPKLFGAIDQLAVYRHARRVLVVTWRRCWRRGPLPSVRRVPVWRSATTRASTVRTATRLCFTPTCAPRSGQHPGDAEEVALVEIKLQPPDGRSRPGERAATPDDEVTEEWNQPHVVFKASVAEPIETYLYGRSSPAT